MAGDDSMVGSRGRESAGFDGWNREFSAGMADSKGDAFSSSEQEKMRSLAGFCGYISNGMFKGEPAHSRQRTKSLERVRWRTDEEERIAIL